MKERTLEQERKGLEQGVCNYLCLSAAKKLSKTITFSDKKWSNGPYKKCNNLKNNTLGQEPVSNSPP